MLTEFMSDIAANPFSRDPRFAGSMSRRQLLTKTAGGFGAVAMAALLAEDNKVGASIVPAASATTQANGGNPLAIRAPHFAARAKRVIFLFMPGGPSQVDTFDPKPRLARQWQADRSRCFQARQEIQDRRRASPLHSSSPNMGNPVSMSANYFRMSQAVPTICASSARWFTKTQTIPAGAS